METPRDAHSLELQTARTAVSRFAADSPSLSLDTQGSRSVEAWFLGPKAENLELFERLIVESIRDHAFWRRNFHPADPTHITETIKRSPDYLKAIDTLQEAFHELLAALKKSVPFFSLRYQGHMNWDLTIPGLLGYFSAMLYNPNNVAFEGSTATTLLELLVGDDLCRMLGYAVEESGSQPRPWGHVTCDGTVANIEAIWAARNLKFYPLAVQAALAGDAQSPLAAGRALTVALPTGGTARFVDLDTWQLLNMRGDDVLGLVARMESEFGLDRAVLADAISAASVQALGLAEFSKRFLGSVGASRVLVPGSKHYSFPKAVALMGLGSSCLINVPVDLDARQDLDALREALQGCLEKRQPVIAVVAVIGTTEESAIDPLADILQSREDFAAKGLVFHVHADAAFGGYHRSLLNDPLDLPAAAFGPPLAAPLSVYAARHLRATSKADSITVDPHKSGFIPYPAGARSPPSGSTAWKDRSRARQRPRYT